MSKVNTFHYYCFSFYYIHFFAVNFVVVCKVGGLIAVPVSDYWLYVDFVELFVYAVCMQVNFYNIADK